MTQAGYSGTPLDRKLGIVPESRVAFVNEPPGFLPSVRRLARPSRGMDVVVLFVRSRAELSKRLARLASTLAPAGALWIAWPKRASKVPTDMTEDVCREVGLPLGIVDVKVCAIDETWSGLKFVWRKELR